MRLTFADIRDTVFIALACLVAGVLVLAPYNPGVPLVALSLSWLAYKRGFRLAVGVALVTSAALALASPVEAAFVALVMLVAGPWAAARMRDRSPWLVFGVVVTAVLVATFGSIAVAAAATGSSLPAFFAEQARLGAAEAVDVARSWGASAPSAQAEVAAMQVMVGQVLPSIFVLAAALSALLSVYSVGWVGDRSGETMRKLPPLHELDLSWHLTWAVIAGLGALAAAKWLGQSEGALGAAGWNLIVLVRGALFLQGVAVFAGLYRRAKLGRPGRIFGYVLLGITEMVAPAIPIGLVSITGLVDLWVNIRKLPRGGEPGPVEEPADEGADEAQ